MAIVSACMAVIVGFFIYLVSQSIFSTKIYELGQSGWTLLGAEVLILVVLFWATLGLLAKNFWHKSFLKIGEKGIEIFYLNSSLKPVNNLYKWEEISSIGDQLGKVQYELYLSLKSADKEVSQKVVIPFELWQSTFRVNKIRKAVEKYSLNSDFKTLPKVALIFGDLLLISFLILVFSLFAYIILRQFAGQNCNCF